MDPILLLETINTFYDQAFDRLLAITLGLVALIGVVIPLAVGWVQVRSLRGEKQSLLSELQNELAQERQALVDKLEAEIKARVQAHEENMDQKLSDLSDKLRRASAAAEARAFHLQANDLTKRDLGHVAVEDYCCAAISYIKSHDEANAQRCIEQLVTNCLPKINSEVFEERGIDADCRRLMDFLKESNKNGRYDNYLRRMKVELSQASKRQVSTAIGSS